MERTYLRTHPWINFRFDPRELKPADWMRLGEASAKIRWLSSSILQPEIADELHRIHLARGIHATTAIEGNTLDAEEVQQLIEGNLQLPPSQQYLAQEVQNVLEACNGILKAIEHDEIGELSTETICRYNALVLQDLPFDQGVTPGEIRTGNVGVARYRGAPPEDCRYLLDRLCAWLNGPDFKTEDSGDSFFGLMAKALTAHLYLAFIHPFDDGNGRTARLVELRIMVEADLPLAVCHLLSNHYNRTRAEYYRVLDRASRVEPYGVGEFFSYALNGLVEGLDEQIKWVVGNQRMIAWDSYITERFVSQETPAGRRRAMLVRDLPYDPPTPRAEITHVSARVAEAYAGKGAKTVTRDLNRLLEMGLIRREGRQRYASNPFLLDEFKIRTASSLQQPIT